MILGLELKLGLVKWNSGGRVMAMKRDRENVILFDMMIDLIRSDDHFTSGNKSPEALVIIN